MDGRRGASGAGFGLLFLFCSLLGATLLGCPRAPADGPGTRSASAGGGCAGLGDADCGRAKNLLVAASSFGNVRHEYLLDPQSSMVPGRGVQKGEAGGFAVLPTRCAAERASPSRSPGGGGVDAATIDFSYIGVAVDQALVAADADLTPFLSAGGEAAEHKISLVAVAFVRDLDPQFFGASEEVAYGGESCSCGRATHFIGAVKLGGLISYEMAVRSGEVHGHALDFVKARIAAGDARVTQTVVGGLEVEGLDGVTRPAAGGSAATKPLGFRVKTPVPIAYALYPLSDVCKFGFPAPEVSPEMVDFGDVPYGREETRLVHVVNRASIDLRTMVDDRTFDIPALGSIDLRLAWKPSGQLVGCERQMREETFQFYPRDESAPVTPKTQSVRVVSRVRTGKGDYRRHEHIDSGSGRKPDYGATRREWTCPADYVPMACRTEKPECGDGKCMSDGYAVNAEPGPNGCRFACKGPENLLPSPFSSNFCRFDAVMECRLRCAP